MQITHCHHGLLRWWLCIPAHGDASARMETIAKLLNVGWDVGFHLCKVSSICNISKKLTILAGHVRDFILIVRALPAWSEGLLTRITEWKWQRTRQTF